MDAVDEEFVVRCHCGECSNGAMVTVVDGAASFAWEVDGDTGTADELRVWLVARGVVLPQAEEEG